MKYLWKIYLYSRYGESKVIGHIWYTEDVPVDCIKTWWPGIMINGQPTAISFDIIKKEPIK